MRTEKAELQEKVDHFKNKNLRTRRQARSICSKQH